MTNEFPNHNNQLSGHWIIVISFVIVAWSFVIFSSANAADTSVADIQSTYQSIQDIKADFTQSTYVAVLEKTIKEPGHFYMKKPGMLRIDYTGEHPKKYISEGKKLWVIDEELNQIETYKVSNESIPKEALEFLKGFGEMEKLFTVTSQQTKRVEKGHVYLKLVPKNKTAQYVALYCDFGPDNILKKMTIENKSGNVSTYVFNNIKVNIGLTSSLFTP